MTIPEPTSSSQQPTGSTPAINIYSAQGLKVKAKEYIEILDVKLNESYYAKEFESKTGVPKTYAVLGAGTVIFLMIFFNFAGQLLTNAISWLYPAYASFKAIETEGTTDDKQWLTYWTVIGCIQMVEYFSDLLLFWFPFYYLFKTLIVLYLALPQTRGAETFYNRILRPYLLSAQSDIDNQAERIKQKITDLTSDVNKTD
ncbi:TB2/DP1, HVA22 family-domain-containing protein [Mycotypha africana]|uniref:TB2/DP1, HVA22 family-domain-containing protein n=1 Tax=Mycotypha africana TaxID=64632 RepID=UPI002301B252|nr:TB2/DP1, HVA22 family-domain-containing protein [Mycotypha africana]KAI8969230.1 TB2/DP1, HVA22 family-domain-containing protein [Mycotypha africana]